MKKVIFDFEFVEGNPCLPISVGMVRVNPDWGARAEVFYAEFPGANSLARGSLWLKDNVLIHLDGRYERDSQEDIRREMVEFLGTDPYQLWAKCGAYDFFLLSQLLGGFQNSPSNFPHTFRELKFFTPHYKAIYGNDLREHHALDDCLAELRGIRKVIAKCQSQRNLSLVSPNQIPE